MIMEEKLTRLFTDYDPELSPDNRFMSRLQHNLETVVLLKGFPNGHRVVSPLRFLRRNGTVGNYRSDWVPDSLFSL